MGSEVPSKTVVKDQLKAFILSHCDEDIEAYFTPHAYTVEPRLKLEMLYELLHSQAITIREQQSEIQQLQLRVKMTPVPPNGHQVPEVQTQVEEIG